MPKINQDKHGYWYTDCMWHGKRQRKSFGPGLAGKKAAELYLAEIKLKIAHNKMGIIEEISAEQFFAQYLIYSKTNKARKSFERDIIIVSNFSPFLQDKNLSQIKAKDIERYKAIRLKTVSKSTVNRELNTIKAAFNKALEWGHLLKDPLKAVKKFKEPKGLLRFFSLQEIELFLWAINDFRLFAPIFLLLQTGMRRDELVYLEWTDIDLKYGTLYVQPKPNWHPKDYEARTIPINDQVKELLSGLPRKGKLVFDDGKGNFYYNTPSSLSRAFRQVLKKLGIQNASLHTLRHTYASHLVMNGVDLATVQKLLGHSQIKTTMRYAHLAPGHLQEAVQKLNNSFCQFSAIKTTKDNKRGQVIIFKHLNKTDK